MRVDALQLELAPDGRPRRSTAQADFGQHAVHHLVAVVQGELLRPVQVAHVGARTPDGLRAGRPDRGREA